MDRFASYLGISFKTSKDVGFTTPLTTLEFLGINISTTPEVFASPSTTKLATIRATLTDTLQMSTILLSDLETLIGKLSFLAQVHSLLRISLSYLYEAFNNLLPFPRPHSLAYTRVPLTTLHPYLHL